MKNGGIKLSIKLLFVFYFCAASFLYAAIPGDANNNGVIDSGDKTATSDHIVQRNVAPGNPDANVDTKVDVADVVTIVEVLNVTPTPTPGADTYNMKDYFLLTDNSWWHYSGFEGGSTDDNFKWTVLADRKTLPNAKQAVRIKTETDQAGDERNKDEDFWIYENNGDLFFWGYHEGGVGNPAFPEQDVFLTDPILFGKDNMQIGVPVTDTGAGIIQIKVGPVTLPFAATVTSSVTITNVLPTRSTPMGSFTNVLRVLVDMDLTANTVTYPMRNNTFFLKKNVGMVVQDQQPDQNDAELQGIDSGQVNSVNIVAE